MENDPNAPKKPLTDYSLFLIEQSAKIEAEHPDFTTDKISGMLMNLWPKLRPEYEAKAAKLMEQYEKDLAAYKPEGGPDE